MQLVEPSPSRHQVTTSIVPLCHFNDMQQQKKTSSNPKMQSQHRATFLGARIAEHRRKSIQFAS